MSIIIDAHEKPIRAEKRTGDMLVPWLAITIADGRFSDGEQTILICGLPEAQVNAIVDALAPVSEPTDEQCVSALRDVAA